MLLAFGAFFVMEAGEMKEEFTTGWAELLTALW